MIEIGLKQRGQIGIEKRCACRGIPYDHLAGNGIRRKRRTPVSSMAQSAGQWPSLGSFAIGRG
jgi:hypothetical protein